MHEEEMDTPCLIFGLQWKGEKLASLGILDKEDASLHWAKFKSYLVGLTQSKTNLDNQFFRITNTLILS